MIRFDISWKTNGSAMYMSYCQCSWMCLYAEAWYIISSYLSENANFIHPRNMVSADVFIVQLGNCSVRRILLRLSRLKSVLFGRHGSKNYNAIYWDCKGVVRLNYILQYLKAHFLDIVRIKLCNWRTAGYMQRSTLYTFGVILQALQDRNVSVFWFT